MHAIEQLLSFGDDVHVPVFRSVTDAEFQNADAAKLASLLDVHGSDKHFTHGYETLYSTIMKPDSAFAILEIGLGTNNTDVPSNMGTFGRPGSSLRAFRDYMPASSVYGADIDDRILFSEDRISTAHVDQLRTETLQTLPARLGVSAFDVIIDDGLHALGANINVIASLLPFLKKGGYMVIEDIDLTFNRSGWMIVDSILKNLNKYETMFILGKAGVYMYVIKYT